MVLSLHLVDPKGQTLVIGPGGKHLAHRSISLAQAVNGDGTLLCPEVDIVTQT